MAAVDIADPFKEGIDHRQTYSGLKTAFHVEFLVPLLEVHMRGIVRKENKAQCVHNVTVEQDIQLHQLAGTVADEFIVQNYKNLFLISHNLFYFENKHLTFLTV